MKESIQYHPGFIGGLGVLLWKYREKIDIDPEKWISKQGIRMDVLILKKDPEVVLDNDMCRIFRGHNILEYKRPDDDLTIDVFAKLMAYAYLYKSRGSSVDTISFKDMTATVYRHGYPRGLFSKLKDNGMEVEEAYPGIFRIQNAAPFPVQVVVGKELDPVEYAMFRVLTPGAAEKDLDTFHKMAFRQREELYREYIDSIIRVSVPANRQLYEKLTKEGGHMYEVLRDLLKDEFRIAEEKGEARGEARGETNGEIKGAIRVYHDEMGLTVPEITAKIMDKYGLKKEEAGKYIEEVLGLQSA